MKILIICGSLRKGSFNRMLANAAKELALKNFVFEDAEIREIPPYDQDVESMGDPPSVIKLKAQIADAEGILVVSPEYNYSVPGVLKNAIDWASRPPRESPLRGKPVGIMGASMGLGGTIRMHSHIRQTFQFLNCPCMMQPEVVVPLAHDKFDAEGNLIHQQTRDFLKAYMEAWEKWIALFA